MCPRLVWVCDPGGRARRGTWRKRFRRHVFTFQVEKNPDPDPEKDEPRYSIVSRSSFDNALVP